MAIRYDLWIDPDDTERHRAVEAAGLAAILAAMDPIVDREGFGNRGANDSPHRRRVVSVIRPYGVADVGRPFFHKEAHILGKGSPAFWRKAIPAIGPLRSNECGRAEFHGAQIANLRIAAAGQVHPSFVERR